MESHINTNINIKIENSTNISHIAETLQEINISDLEFDNKFNTSVDNLLAYESKLKIVDKVFSYGTTGFRYNENELEQVAFRVAIVACLQSQCLETPIGIMITASHNKYTDNGIKIAGQHGTSIPSNWEKIYTNIVNSKNLQVDLEMAIKSLLTQKCAKIKYFFRDHTPIINLAYDTRRSSVGLVNIIKDCLKVLNAKFHDYGVLTTPALQFLTLVNQMSYKQIHCNLRNFSFVSEEVYWKFLESSFFAFNTFCDKFYAGKQLATENKYENEILLDCANGVAGFHAKAIAKLVGEHLKVKFINTDYSVVENLNNNCGAEHVHKEKKMPMDYPSASVFKNLSFDEIKMVDGDHLSCLYALTLRHLINKLSKSLQVKFLNDIKIGVVCTAYSNGAFMNYITKTLGFKLVLAKTGVKYLHAKAKQFDLAVYFESNGHGTVYYDDSIRSKIEKLNCFIESSQDSQTLELLSIFLSNFNKTTGDSLSAFIATECALKLMNMSILDVYNIYKELEYVNVKVVVKDKFVFLPNEDETRLIEPTEIQDYIDGICESLQKSSGRCFVRPSGTEDIVRIYAEAETLEDAKGIAELVKTKITETFA